MSALTQAQVRELLSYDPETGVFLWRSDQRGSVRAGTVAGTLEATGQRRIAIDRRRYLAHRLAWLYVYGEWPAIFVDHIDCDPGNNRINNLRLATRSQNGANSRVRVRSGSGIKGVHWDESRQKWSARITVNRQTLNLGRYASADAASAAYATAAIQHFGEFARRSSGPSGTYHYVPFEDVPQRISDGYEYIGINGAAAHRVIMREPDSDEFDASIEPEAA